MALRTDIPCICGQRLTLVAVFGDNWGIYRCRSCRREAIETDGPPNRDQRTGQDVFPKAPRSSEEIDDVPFD